jgi:predicted ATPase/GAF domain-containing protein
MIKKWQTSAKNEKRSGKCLDIKLKRLNTAIIGQILADTLHCSEIEAKSLAALVYAKTNGNPFFIHEFLRKLWENGMIRTEQGWIWDTAEIQKAEITDNVVELMTAKLNRFPDKTISAIKVAACEGVEFSFHLVAEVMQKSEDSLFEDLKQALDEGILIKIGDKGKFSHNKIREIVYLLADENERRELHLKIGRWKWKKSAEKIEDKVLFDITNHMNKSGGLLKTSEKIEIARLNLKAGQKANAAISYDMAYRFFKEGIERLPQPVESAWRQEYELTLSLFIASCEAGFLTGKHEEAERFFKSILENAKEVLDKIKIYEIKIHVFVSLQKNIEAVQLCREALSLLGKQMPARASKMVILKEFASVYFRIVKRKGGMESLKNLPELTDPVQLAVARILITCAEPAYLSDAAYFPIIVLKLLNLTLKYGNSQYSSYAYVVYGSILCDLLGNIDAGLRFGKLALEILEKYKDSGIKAKTYFIYGTGINHWKNHMTNDLKYLLESYKIGSETGDLGYASYAINGYIYRLFFSGESLVEVKKTIGIYYPVLKKYNQLGSVHECELWHKFILALSGDMENDSLIKGDIDKTIIFVKKWTTDNDMNQLGNYTLVRLILLTLSDHFLAAIEVAQHGEKYVTSIVGDIFALEFYFYYSLAILGNYAHVDADTQGRYLRKLAAYEKQMKKWAAYAPENYRNKYLLIKAGRCSLSGKVGKAAVFFSQAVNLARENGFRHEEAIACECAARFYFTLGLDGIALEYTKKAHYLFKLWNANAKVTLMENKYPELVESILQKKESSASGSSESTSPSLDFDAIIKSSHIISGEIVMEKLLEKLLKILMEDAGARKIILLLKKREKLFIEAEGKTEAHEISVFQGIPIEEYDLPQSVIRFVARTKDFVALDDSSEESLFSRDSYFLNRKPMSLLCMPVVHQDALVGILYLENQLILNAFTGEQQETLKVLSAQAAVSLQNAFLYENLTQAEERARTILETTTEGFLEIDGNGIITGVNPGMSAICGRTKKKLVGTSFFQLLSPGDKELALQQFRIHNLDRSSS